MRETASTKLLILIATREREERDSHHLVVIEGPLAILNKDLSQNMKGRRRYKGGHIQLASCARLPFQCSFEKIADSRQQAIEHEAADSHCHKGR